VCVVKLLSFGSELLISEYCKKVYKSTYVASIIKELKFILFLLDSVVERNPLVPIVNKLEFYNLVRQIKDKA
jgi:hypothetical protein